MHIYCTTTYSYLLYLYKYHVYILTYKFYTRKKKNVLYVVYKCITFNLYKIDTDA